MRIHCEVWAAAARLHERGEAPFTRAALLHEVERLFGDVRPGVSAYVSADANASAKKAIAVVYNYLLTVDRGTYRLCRATDPVHPSRQGCPLFPQQGDVDEEHWPLWRKWSQWQRGSDVSGASESLATMQKVMPAASRPPAVPTRAQAARLVAHLKALPGFKLERSPASGGHHMGAVLSEAVLQAGVNYRTVVLPRVEKLKHDHPRASTTSAFLDLLSQRGPEQLLDFRGAKIDRLLALVNFLKREGVETTEDFAEWLRDASHLERLGRLPGMGPKTVDYLQILVGLDSTAIDRHLTRALREAGLTPGDYHQQKAVIEEAAGLLGVDKATLDYSLWLYMSTRERDQPGASHQTILERILGAIGALAVPICDDCLTRQLGLKHRQQAFLRTRQLASAGMIRRGRGTCGSCGRWKNVSWSPELNEESFDAQLPAEDVVSAKRELHPDDGLASGGSGDRPAASAPRAESGEPDNRPWYWEGNVQAALVSHLREKGYRITRTADTASREAGKDIMTIGPDGRELWVSVKGYPTPKPSANTQSRHWFSHAIFDMVLYRGQNKDASLAIGLPAGFKSYAALAQKVDWFLKDMPVTVYWVNKDGMVTVA